MEVRKIQLIGSSSYMVSLPKKWITSLNLKQGDEVILHVEEDRVVVIPKKFEKSKLVRIVMKGLPQSDDEFLRRYIYALYMLGFDEVVIEDIEISPSLMSKLLEITHKLIGMEILDVTSSKVVFRILVTPELDIETVLRRMSQMVSAMFEDAKRYITNKERLESIILAEENVDRFYWLAVRLENRITRESVSWNEIRYVLGSRMIAKMIEDIADNLLHFVSYMRDANDNLGIEPILDDIEDAFNEAFKIYHSIDLEMSAKAIKRVDELQRRILNAINNASNLKLALALQTLLEILDEIKSIDEIAINRAVREVAESVSFG